METNWARVRKPLGVGVALVGCFVVARILSGAWPHSVRVEFQLDPKADELSVDYIQDGAAAKSARFKLDPASQGVLVHKLELARGRYEIQATVYDNGVATEHLKAIEVPVTVPIRLDLSAATGEGQAE